MAREKPESQATHADSLLQNVLLSMPVGVAWADPETGVITYVNRKFTRMFGYGIHDLSTIHNWIMNCYADPEQAREIDAFWAKELHTLRDVDTELEGVELEIRCRDGSIKTVLSGKIILPNKGGALSTFLDITPRKHRELQIRKQAMEDPLTGVLNRRAFSQLLEESVDSCDASGTSMALMLVDLDGFKAINDTHGHDHGDLLLKMVAERLSEAMREQDSLCRIGGDEFGVIVGELTSVACVEDIADRILHKLLKHPYSLDGESHFMGASIGIGLYPENASSDSALFRYADAALYRAKDEGRARWCR